MKVVILAGGHGTRLSEETALRPKPMVEIGGRPILWHIMKFYSQFGCQDFVICLGYKGYVIKEYFANYFLHNADVTFDIEHNRVEVHHQKAEPWRVTLIDTGVDTMTGGRIKRVASYLGDETFMATYGDGLSDVDVVALLAFHHRHGKIATMTSVQPSGRFGALDISSSDVVCSFKEKLKGDGAWVNGGFFVFEPSILDYIAGDNTVLEREPLENLARDGQLMAYRHAGFWKPMDTLREKNEMENLWEPGKAPWKVWHD